MFLFLLDKILCSGLALECSDLVATSEALSVVEARDGLLVAPLGQGFLADLAICEASGFGFVRGYGLIYIFDFGHGRLCYVLVKGLYKHVEAIVGV